MRELTRLKKAELPIAPPLRKLIGPSFILLGLGLGSGELILWPYLSANFGLGIIWAAVIGITFQFFINMEISRYTLATGESIFVGLTRKFGRFAPIWFIVSTLVPWMWPGITASAATLFSESLGIPYSGLLGIILLILIGIILSLGSVVYKTQEKFQKVIILTGIPFVFAISLYFAKTSDWVVLLKGVAGFGESYRFLPHNIPLATLLGALAYAGAGGTLNLAQSFYVKEKGYGMGKYAGKITALASSKKEEMKLEGVSFDTTPRNINRFWTWWKKINLEHMIVFWGTGALSIMMLSLLSFATVYGKPGLMSGIKFVIFEANVIGETVAPVLGSLFLIMCGVMLFGTQFSVFGSTSRIMSENLILYSRKYKVKNTSNYFYFFLWLQILAGSLIFLLGFTEPLTLVVIGAVLNAFNMFIYTGMLIKLNTELLPEPIKPSTFRKMALYLAFFFYGGFSIFTIVNSLTSL